jgi:hypothetical protein
MQLRDRHDRRRERWIDLRQIMRSANARHPDGRPFAENDVPMVRVLRGEVVRGELVALKLDGARSALCMCGWCLRGASEHHEWTKTPPIAASDLAELLRTDLTCSYPVAEDTVKDVMTMTTNTV